MKILVTGGTGVVGAATVRALLAGGHSVRLLSRHARSDADRWRGSGTIGAIEAREGSVATAADVAGAAEGCDAVLHIAGIVEERPPDVTFQSVNVGGTRNLLAEAEVAGVQRFVYVSSLGADSGESAYHASKRDAEELVRRFRGDWLICRPGNIYGPGDEVISYLLQIVRASPVAPVIDGGDQPFQPLYADDLGAALAVAVTRSDLSRQVLLLAGPEVTTTRDLVDRLARLTGQQPVAVGVPGALATLGARVASSLLGVKVPLTEDKVTMLREGNIIPPGEVNAVTDILGVQPTPLEEGLRRLANSQPEQLPDQGTGTLVRRRYGARLAGVRRTPQDLFDEFRRRFFELVPESTVQKAEEPAGEPASRPSLEPGSVLTLSLPFRGNVQVRIIEVTGTSLTLVTLAGHPLAGSNTFRFSLEGEDPRFTVETCDRSANLLDELAMLPFGRLLKRFTWTTLVEETARMAGAMAPVEVETEEQPLAGEEEKAAVADMERRVAAVTRQDERQLQEEARARLAGARV